MKTIVVNLLSDPIVWSVLFALVMYAVGLIVSKTKTTKDDAVLKVVKGFIYNAFNLAEKAIPDAAAGQLGKVDVALKHFNEAYEGRFGSAAPENILDLAKAEWSILATELKKAKA